MKRVLEGKNYVKQALTYKIFVCKKDFAEFTGRLGFVSRHMIVGYYILHTGFQFFLK